MKGYLFISIEDPPLYHSAWCASSNKRGNTTAKLYIGKYQESRREGWTDAAIMLCKLNKSL
jgi:hypothetical protein